jgi:hypothetical protein
MTSDSDGSSLRVVAPLCSKVFTTAFNRSRQPCQCILELAGYSIRPSMKRTATPTTFVTQI